MFDFVLATQSVQIYNGRKRDATGETWPEY